MENEIARLPPLWEHALTNILGHDHTTEPGMALRQWVSHQGIHCILDLLSWDAEELKTDLTQKVYSIDYHGQAIHLRTNQVKQMGGLMSYMKHKFQSYNSGTELPIDSFHPFSPHEWTQHTFTQMRMYFVQHIPNPHGPEAVPPGPISSTKPTGYSPAAIELMEFKKGIKRETAAYPSIKDERYFDGFQRSLFIVSKSHKCNEVLDPIYNPGSEPEQQELFEAKQTVMFSVFNANLQTDMGMTIVRRHLPTTDVQSASESSESI